MADFVRLTGTAHDHAAGAAHGYRRSGHLSAEERQERIKVTLILRERTDGTSLAQTLAAQASHPLDQVSHLSHDQLVGLHGADPKERSAVLSWANARGLTLAAKQPAFDRLVVEGTVAQVSAAFGVRLEKYRHIDPRSGRVTEYRDHTGELTLPADVAARVTTVLGVNSKPAAQPRLRILAGGAKPLVTYEPEQLADLYQYPQLPNGGAGVSRTVGIAELGGAVNQADLAAFKKLYPGLELIEEGVDGAVPTPDPQGADIEVALDWQNIARAFFAKAPQGKLTIVVKYGPNTEQGFADVEASFASDGRDYDAVSTSWGAPEDQWTTGGMDAMEKAFQLGSAKGITYSNASGDNGSTDGETDGKQHADHPASAPTGVGCGGTTLVSANGVIISEVVWNEQSIGEGAGGGEVSTHFGVPAYQSNNGINPTSGSPDKHHGRGVPDMSANADPITGYDVVYNGQHMNVGGTSAVAPMNTALVSLICALTGRKLGFYQPAMYAMFKAGKGFNDITSGNNGANAATKGWDAASGLGSPIGTEQAANAGSQPPTPAPCPPQPSKGKGGHKHHGKHGHHGHGGCHDGLAA